MDWGRKGGCLPGGRIGGGDKGEGGGKGGEIGGGVWGVKKGKESCVF